ncbi:E3 ubiquitin-protein ligase RFI2 [Heracleum sosnowskyi]|uniref:E3 ubiquitin-protein ligase RFI2 n=1 Tax=Heracleum sosnowskyi TaxID=360622 RepID=A0AAD8MYM6_9APIA|nr:E3 ubiquitin-protein ligase RFI2 [Heracleum sosnowskyi]
MEFGDLDHVDDGDGCGKALSAVSCTICLDVVTDSGDRSFAKLQCGHQFHLDCIGSAFNAKGAMQCPNCRKLEKGQWLYSNGSRSYAEFTMDGLVQFESSYPNNSEMIYVVNWGPIYTRLPSSFDGDVFSSITYHGLIAQHAVIVEPTAVLSASYHWPYVAYSGPYSSALHSRGSVSNSSTFRSHLNSLSAPTSSTAGPDQLSFPSMTQRVARDSIGMQRSGSFVRPSSVDHGTDDRAGSSVAASRLTPYRDIAALSRERMLALQAYFQHPPGNSQGVRTPYVPSAERSNGHMNITRGEPGAELSEQASRVSFPSTSAAGRNVLETQNSMPNHFHAWEREQYTSFPSNEAEREPIWRHGSKRMPSQHQF